MIKELVLTTVLTFVGLSALGTSNAQASTCLPTNPPEPTYQCNGRGTPIQEVVACEPPTSVSYEVGGCYDTDGDCSMTVFSKATATGIFQVVVGPSFTMSQSCVAVGQYDTGIECLDS